MPKHTSALDHPELQSFLATLPPDAEEQRLAAAFRAVDAQMVDLRGREQAARQEIAAIDVAMLDADAKQYEQLLTRRRRLDADIQTLPVQLAMVTSRRVTAHLAYLARVQQLARAEVALADAELVAPLAASSKLKVELFRDDSRRTGAPLLTDDERAAKLEQVRTQHTEMQPAQDRRNRAQLIVDMCQILAGEQTNLNAPASWPGGAARLAVGLAV